MIEVRKDSLENPSKTKLFYYNNLWRYLKYNQFKKICVIIIFELIN